MNSVFILSEFFFLLRNVVVTGNIAIVISGLVLTTQSSYTLSYRHAINRNRQKLFRLFPDCWLQSKKKKTERNKNTFRRSMAMKMANQIYSVTVRKRNHR